MTSLHEADELEVELDAGQLLFLRSMVEGLGDMRFFERMAGELSLSVWRTAVGSALLIAEAVVDSTEIPERSTEEYRADILLAMARHRDVTEVLRRSFGWLEDSADVSTELRSMLAPDELKIDVCAEMVLMGLHLGADEVFPPTEVLNGDAPTIEEWTV